MSDDGLAIEDVGYDVETEHKAGLKEFLINEVKTKVSLLQYGRGRKATVIPASHIPPSYERPGGAYPHYDSAEFDEHLEKVYQEFSRIPGPPRPPDPLIREGDNRRLDSSSLSEDTKASEIGTVTRERDDAK